MSDPLAQEDKAVSGDWIWHPPLPLDKPTPFAWPLSVAGIWRWFSASWLGTSWLAVWLVMAIVSWVYFMPDMAAMREFEPGWILQIYLRNLFCLGLIAGGLHFWLYMRKGQGDALKFDHRALARGAAVFLFSDQVKDNMLWSLVSGVGVWTLYEVLYYWVAASGWVPMVTFLGNPVWFVLWFGLISLWSSFHFYWIHRWLHWPPLYKLAHALHHKNVAIGPWSGIAMHPIEHLLYFSSIAIHFLVASHPIHVIFHLFLQGLNPATSHSGYQSIVVGGKPRWGIGDFFHQLHHRHFNCNYGTSEFPWDRWFGSDHDGTIAATQRMRTRMRKER